MVQGQIDVEDVLRCDSARRLDEGGGPHPLMGDHSCFGQTFHVQGIINHLRLMNATDKVYVIDMDHVFTEGYEKASNHPRTLMETTPAV